MLILGIHTKLKSDLLNDKPAKTMEDAIDRDITEFDLNATQIFVAGPQSNTLNKLNYEDINTTCKEISVSVHSSYTTVGIWQVDNLNKNLPASKAKLTTFNNQLEACKKIGAEMFVLHINKLPKEKIAETMKLLKPLAKKTGVTISLEMVASKATEDTTYETGAKLDALIELLGVDEDYYNITIDTAHIFAAGCDITTKEQMTHWLNTFKHKRKIGQIHLNGNSSELASGKDKHAIAFSKDDKIWHNVAVKDSGIDPLVKFAVTHSIPIIMEINVGTEKDAKSAMNSIKNIK